MTEPTVREVLFMWAHRPTKREEWMDDDGFAEIEEEKERVCRRFEEEISGDLGIPVSELRLDCHKEALIRWIEKNLKPEPDRWWDRTWNGPAQEINPLDAG